MCSKTTNFAVGIIISVWTVIQTSFHVLWTFSGHYLYTCKIKPSHYLLVAFYLTYFYNSECGHITVENDSILSPSESYNTVPKLYQITNETDVFKIMQFIAGKAQLPREAIYAQRTNIYMLAFILLDGLWVLSAFLLFAGTCFQVKRSTSLIFYCPWLVFSGCIILLDVVSAVHYGLDLLKVNRTYTSWLRLIGVTNYKDFTDLNDHPSAEYIPTASTIIMSSLSCRFFIIWILNIVNFSHILNIAVLAYQNRADDKEVLEAARRKRRKAADSVLNINTSESRIRSWQLFYGAIETTSTGSSVSLKSLDRELHNGNTSKHKKTSFRVTAMEGESNLDSFDQRISTITSETMFETANSSYMRFSDVADVLETGPRRSHRKSSEESLNGHLPWSYVASTNGDNRNKVDRTFDLSDSINRRRERNIQTGDENGQQSTAL